MQAPLSRTFVLFMTMVMENPSIIVVGSRVATSSPPRMAQTFLHDISLDPKFFISSR